MNNIEHPSYDISLTTVNCRFEFFINDILLYSFKPDDESLGTGQLVDIPLNSTLLKNGLHAFSIKLLPWINEKFVNNYSYAEITGSISDTDKIYIPKTQRDEDIKLFKVETPWKKLENDISLPFFELRGEFEAAMLPFELKGWSDSVDLKKETERKLFEEVFSFYQQLHALIAQRNATKYDELFREKEALISKAFYYDYHVNEKKDPMYTAMVNDRKNATKELFAEEGLELIPLVVSELKLLFQAEGKLVSLVRHDNTPALRFNDPKNDGEVEMEVRLHRKTKGSALTII